LIVEALLILWFFRNLYLFKNDRPYFLSGAAFLVLWLLETILSSKLFNAYNSVCGILFSFVIVLMSISIMNEQLIKERASLTKNSVFIICVALVLYNTLTVFSETFYAYGLKLSLTFQKDVLFITSMENILSNVLYAFAIYFMPKKQSFTLQY
jgi:hypothetical protein